MAPSIGVGVFVLRHDPKSGNKEFLLGHRSKGCQRAPGIWALPGGMREDNENLADCARREVREETGLEVEIFTQGEYMDCALGISDHYPREEHITCWIQAQYRGGEPRIIEPTKCDEWQWVDFRWITRKVDFTVGEQKYWIPMDIWRTLSVKMGFIHGLFT